MQISPLDDTRSHLGEGPVWDVVEQALFWVDSMGPAIFRHDWASRTTTRWEPPGDYVGSLAVRRSGGLVVAMDQGLYCVDFSCHSYTLIAEPLADLDNARFNDGKVDRAGNFVTGGVYGNAGLGLQPQPLCPMIHLSGDHTVKTVMEQFLCFNGPCFSPDGGTLYVNGRGNMRHIEALPYDQKTGEVSLADGRVLIDDVNPDGTTVDADGVVWSAQWDDGCVIAITPNGNVINRIDLPGHVVSSVMFGGPNLNIMFVTTLGQPHWGTIPGTENAGATFVIEGLNCRGLPENRFAG